MGILSKLFGRKQEYESNKVYYDNIKQKSDKMVAQRNRTERYAKFKRGIIGAANTIANAQQRIVARQTDRGLVYRGRQRVPSRVAQAIAQAGGSRIPGSSGNKGYGSRGRPRGPSGRYIIPGVGAVGVYEWRKWYRKQRAMANLQQGQQIAQQGYKDYSAQPSYASPSQLQPQQSTIYQQPIQSLPPAQPRPMQQSAGVSLWDNSFMKLDSGKSNNVQGGAMMKSFNPETPVGNPKGDYYTEPDFFSGKQVLRQRSQDKLFKW